MESFKTIKYLFVSLLLIFAFSSCSKKTEYTHAIPSDVTTVASIDVKSIAEKSGINDEENSTLKQHLTDALKNGLNEETTDQLSKIMEKPSKSGFDFEKPVYYFVSKAFNSVPVVDLPVDDRGDLNKAVKALSKSNLCSEPHETDHFSYTVFNGRFVLAYNKGTALFVHSPEGATDKILLLLDKVMTEKKEESFCVSPAYDKLQERKGEIKFYENIETLAFGGDVSFNNGSVVIQVEKMQGKNTTATPYSSFQPITNALLDRFPKSTPFVLSMGINGSESYKELATAVGLDSEESPFIQKLMTSLQGDVTIGLNEWNSKKCTFIAYAQVKDAAAIRSLANMKGAFGGTFKKIGASDFQYHVMNSYVWFGLDENLLYITNDGTWANNKFKLSGGDKGVYLQSPAAAQAKGKRLYFQADPIAILMLVPSGSARMVPAAALQNISYIRGYDVSPTVWRVEMAMKDKNSNSLKQIVKIVRQIVGM